MRPLAKIRSLGRDRSGAALVEFTLLAPLLISLMCGLSEFGLILRQHQVMEKGVRDAGRFLSRSYGDPCSGAADADWTTAVGVAKTLAVTGAQSGAPPLLAGWADTATVSVSVACVDNGASTWRGGPSLPVVTVTARAPYQDLGMLGALGLTAPTLTVSHQELKVS